MDAVEGVVPIAELVDERRHLLDLASRMLGSGHEAESVVAEVYRRWYGLSEGERAAIERPRAWLVSSASRSCLLRALPDGDRASHAVDTVVDAVSKAVVGGRESDGEEAGEVAGDDVTGRAEHSLRARRAQPVTPRQGDAVTRAVRDACVAEDAGVLASLLAPEVSVFFDGGGRIRALTRPLHGNGQVAVGLLTLLARRPFITLDTHSVNGRTGLVVRYGRQVAAVIILDIAGPHVVQVWVTLNPDKLRSWNRPARAP
jgi:RNA polymerase sigma-70 factor (ECF subfamily)